MRSLLAIVVSYCLLFTQAFGQGETNLSQELSDLTQQERDELKDLNISEGLQDSLQSTSSDLKPNLTADDRKALKLLGYSDQEIENLSLGTFTNEDGVDNLKSRAKNYAEGKKKEAEEGVKGSLVPGLASSVIGLGFASMMGLIVGIRCSNQPSALVFAGSAAAWVGLEMMIWKGYQIRMKEIETLQEASNIPQVINAKVDRAKKIIKNLEDRFKANPTTNFEAFLEENAGQVDKLKKIAKDLREFLNVAKDRQFGALRSIHKSIELAAETSKKKARNATVAAVGFGSAAALAGAEHYNVFNSAGTCQGGGTGEVPWPLSLIPSAHASFANVGDFDKIGIPLGAGLGAAYVGFQQKFADKIYNSAVTRAVVFLSMAGIATLAAVKLNEAAKFLQKQADEMDIFVNVIEDKIDRAETGFSNADVIIKELKKELIPRIEEIADKVKDNLNSAKDKIEDRIAEGVDVNDVASELGLDEEELKKVVEKEDLTTSEIEKELGDLSGDNLPEINPSLLNRKLRTHWFEKILNQWMHQAHAAKNEASCFRRAATYLIEDAQCSCRATKKCSQTPFPRNLSLKKTDKNLMSFAKMAYSVGSLVNQSSNAVMVGLPEKGLNGFAKVKGLYGKLNRGTMNLVSRSLNKPFTTKMMAQTIGGALKTTQPALRDYYKAKRSIRVKPRGFVAQMRNKGNGLFGDSPSSGDIKRQALKRKLLAIKALGNKSITHLEQEDSKEIYDYSRSAITKDSSKNLFDVIKKRYLIIQSEGRLSL